MGYQYSRLDMFHLVYINEDYTSRGDTSRSYMSRIL